MAAKLLQNAKAWLVALIACNGVVAVLMHGGVLEPSAFQASPTGTLPEVPTSEWPACAAWGPFVDAESMNPLIREIEAAGGEVDVVRRRLAFAPDYLLLVGPQGSFEAARRVHGELESQSIENHIVPRGPFAKSLEVGVFADRAEALARQARIEELGYEVDLRELERPGVAFQLIARLQRQPAPALAPAADCAVVAPGHRFL